MCHHKRVRIIACSVLNLDFQAAAKRLGVDVQMEFLPAGLHESPHQLHDRLQEAIDRVSREQDVDRIVIGYGTCGMGTVHLSARTIPLAIPRVHDCIALFLGSDRAYQDQFNQYPGTYYISVGWAKEKVLPQSMPGETRATPHNSDYERLVAKYGEENAEAIRYFLTSWQRNYQRAAFIETEATTHNQSYEKIAKAMAEEFGWRYEHLKGSGHLLEQVLLAEESTDEILVVPPQHTTVYDAAAQRLRAVPIHEGRHDLAHPIQTLFLQTTQRDIAHPKQATLGLGIDAGGTYTDAVIYAFDRDKVLQKSKALTTHWDYSIGIERALTGLVPERLARIDLVAISTTLATNAIVEGRGQKVGLLIMPPYGLFDPTDIRHRPIAVIDGRLDYDGSVLAPINPNQIRQVVREMIERDGVNAFAVAGYFSDSNPSHELEIKALIHDEFRHHVTCGDDVSEELNYRIRAQTAALNAGIIPIMESLLDHIQAVLQKKNIHAPVMVVKSDGSLMTVQAARQKPIETILSGPAASVAGALYLAKISDALVVDMGGTTTDTAVVHHGMVRSCRKGTTVGRWKTHIKALDLRTLGLGGDSSIVFEKQTLAIGPQRVAPVAWLAHHSSNLSQAIDWIEKHSDHFTGSTQRTAFVALNGCPSHVTLNREETRIVEILQERPFSLHELAYRLSGHPFRSLPLERLAGRNLIESSGLTPTDLLHATKQLNLWNGEVARRICKLISRIIGKSLDELAATVFENIVHRLALELIKIQFNESVDPHDISHSPAAMELIENALHGGNQNFSVAITLHHPIIGIGAPIHYFLPQAAEILHTQAVIPLHADVANAIGAIAGTVQLHKRVMLSPNHLGIYTVHGLPGAPTFDSLDAAHHYALEQLKIILSEMADRAGTSQSRIELSIEDKVAPLADGNELFFGRILEARLTGRPDITRLSTR